MIRFFFFLAKLFPKWRELSDEVGGGGEGEVKDLMNKSIQNICDIIISRSLKL